MQKPSSEVAASHTIQTYGIDFHDASVERADADLVRGIVIYEINHAHLESSYPNQICKANQ